MTTEQKTQPLSWVPYKLLNVDTELSNDCFIVRAAAMVINGTECMVLTRGEVDLDAVLKHLTDNDYDITAHYKATLIKSDGVQVELPETPEARPVNLPPAEQLEEGERETQLDGITTGGVPTYQGAPVVKYLDPAAADAGLSADEHEGVAQHVEDDDEL